MPLTQRDAQRIAQDYAAAWNAASPEAVAGFFTEDCVFIINRGDPWDGPAQVAEMAAGFFADVPDLKLVSDDIRLSGTHAVNVWTFSGNHVATGNAVKVRGWEEWELTEDGKIREARGWYDAEDYARQVG